MQALLNVCFQYTLVSDDPSKYNEISLIGKVNIFHGSYTYIDWGFHSNASYQI